IQAEGIMRRRGEPAPQPGETPGAGNAVDPAKMAATDNIKLKAADGTEFTLTGDDVRSLMQERAERESRKAMLPADAGAYQAALPEGFDAGGVEVKIDDSDPALADLRAFAHRSGWSQQQFSDVLAIEAARAARNAAQYKAAYGAEVAKLGTTGPSRV